MKRILLGLVLCIFAGSVYSQAGGQDFQGIVGLKMLSSDTVEVKEIFDFNGEVFVGTTQTSPADNELATKAYVDGGGFEGITILGFDKETGIANIATTEGVVDTALFEGRYGYLTSDTILIRNDSIILGNSKGVPLLDVIVDSVTTEFNVATGDLSTYWYIGATQYGPTVENLDGRNVLYSDSTDIYYSQHDVDSLLLIAGQQNDFTITLPSAGSVFDRIAGATEVPAGWTLTADGLNINIEHNLGRYCNAVAVFATSTAPANQRLDDTAAENGLINIDTNNTKILSLATILKEIRIFVSFTQ